MSYKIYRHQRSRKKKSPLVGILLATRGALIVVAKFLGLVLNLITKQLILLAKFSFKHFRKLTLPAKVVTIAVIVIVALGMNKFVLQKLTQTNNPIPSFERLYGSAYAYQADIPATKMKTLLSVSSKAATVEIRRESSVLRIDGQLNDSKLSTGKSAAKFSSKDQGIIFDYQLTGTGVKENIVLNKPVIDNRFVSNLTLTDLVINKSAEGMPVFTNNKGEYQFHFEKPYAEDAAGNRTYQVSYKITPTKDLVSPLPETLKSADKHRKDKLFGIGDEKLTGSRYTLVTEVDPSWLMDPKRIYPVTIDPTVTHNTTATFATGELNRVFDTGSGSNPNLTTYYQELPADTGTVGLWHFNETSNGTCTGAKDACDSSGLGNHGTQTSTTITTTDQQLGAAARVFNGTTSYIEVADHASLKGTSAITLEAWVKMTSTAQAGIVGKWTPSTFEYLLYSTGSGTFGCSINNGAYVFSISSLSTNTWYHVACTYDRANVSIYVNGKLEASTSYTAAINTSTIPVRIGRYSSNESAFFYFPGNIDEVRISNIARSPDAILASAQRRPYGVYTSPVMDLASPVESFNSFTWNETGVKTGDGETASSSASLVAQWNFNATSGTTATNDAGVGTCGGTASNCDGTLTNFASTGSQDAAANSGWTSANRRWGAGAIMTDGSNDFIDMGNPAALSFERTNSFSLAAWVKHSTSANGSIIAKQAAATTYQGYHMYRQANLFGFVLANNIGTTNLINVTTTTNTVNDGQWHYYVVTYDGSSTAAGVKLYIDGIQRPTTAVNDALSGTIITTSNFRISQRGNNDFANNAIVDAVSVYSRVLPLHEILSNYNAANMEFETRVGNTATPEDGTWEAWRPVTSEVQINSMDNVQGWATPSATIWRNVPIATASSTFPKVEGNGALKATVGSMTVDPSVVGYWKFEETGGSSAFVKDSSGLGNHGTPTGSTTAHGIFGKSRTFNGTSDYITVTDHASLKPTAITIESWFKTATDGRQLVHKYQTAVPNAGYAMTVGSGAAANKINCWVGGSAWTVSTTSVTDNTWHHGACTYDGTNVRVYVDGKLEATQAQTGNLSFAINLGIGAYNVASPSLFFGGDIDEVRISNRARPASEIAESARLGFSHRMSLQLSSTDISSSTKVPFYIAADKPGRYIDATLGETAYANYETDANTTAFWHLDENGSASIDDQNLVFNDTFPGSSLDTTKWTEIDPGANKISVSSGLILSSGAVAAWDSAIISNYRFPNIGTNTIYARFTTSSSVASPNHMMIGWGQDQTADPAYTKISHALYWNAGTFYYYQDGAVAGGPFGSGYAANTTYEMKITLNASLGTAKYEVKGGAYTNWTTLVTADSVAITTSSFRVHLAQYQHTGTINQISVYSPKNIIDSSGNSLHASEVGAVFTKGAIGGARQFNGTSDYIPVGSNSILGAASAATLEAWIKPTGSYTDYRAILYASNGAASNNWYMQHNATTGVINCGFNTGSVTAASSPSAPPANIWSYVVCTYDGANILLYLNGALVASAAKTGTLVTDNAVQKNIGKYEGNTQYYAGTLDEIRVSNIARSADQIRQAYDVGRRTHPVNIDFNASLGSTNLIGSSVDLSFDVNATTSGFATNAGFLFPGDQIIVKENYNGTEYIAQGAVNTVNHTTGATTVTSWDSSSTFPAGGYSPNATVFKWQLEWADLTGAMATHEDALTRLTLRLTDGNQGRTIWLDDLRKGGPYLTTPTGSTITSSTGNRYFQHRTIESSWDPYVSSSLTSVTLDYTLNSAPNTPSLDSPSDGATGVTLSPQLKTTTTDTDSDYLRYKIELCTNLAMTQNCQTFDQTVSQTGWSGQDTQSGTAYASGTQATYTIQTPLTADTTYYWRSYAKDPGGSDTFSGTQGTPFSFTTNAGPTPPTALLTNGSTNPSGLAPESTPYFSAIHHDAEADSADQYQIQVSENSNFGAVTHWDSGFQSMTTTADGVRSPDINYGGATLQANTTFYWRIRFKDTIGNTGEWSTEAAFFTTTQLFSVNCTLQKNATNTQIIVQWSNNNTVNDGYTIEKSIDGGGFSAFTTTGAGGTSATDNTVTSGHTYAYRVYATLGAQTSEVCTSSTLSLQTGNFRMEGLQLEGLQLF